MKPSTIAILAVSAGLIATGIGMMWGLAYGLCILGLEGIPIAIAIELS